MEYLTCWMNSSSSSPWNSSGDCGVSHFLYELLLLLPLLVLQYKMLPGMCLQNGHHKLDINDTFQGCAVYLTPQSLWQKIVLLYSVLFNTFKMIQKSKMYSLVQLRVTRYTVEWPLGGVQHLKEQFFKKTEHSCTFSSYRRINMNLKFSEVASF